MQRVLVAGATGCHQGELLAFFTTMSTTDAVAPTFGRRRLVDHFADCREESR